MNLYDIAKRRQANQQIVNTKFCNAVDMVQWLCVVQAQEYAQAKWGLGLRLKHLKDSNIENDFNDGKILRTHLLRPTWHFISENDIRWLLALSAPRVNAANAYMYRQLELNSTVFKRCNKILEKILQGGKQLTRNSINEVFLKNRIAATGHRLSYIMMYAELAGIICSGARQGNQFTYALLDERVKAQQSSIDKDVALAKLASRYFQSRGPATLKDFSTWSGLTLTDCKKGIELIKSNLAKIMVESIEYFFTDCMMPNDKKSQDICLLPVYDEFIMGYKDRNAILQHRNALQFNLPFQHNCMIVEDGQIIGTWRRGVHSNIIDIQVQFFSSLKKIQHKAFDKAVKCLQDFVNMDVIITSNIR